jgi:hypothetical protein
MCRQKDIVLVTHELAGDGNYERRAGGMDTTDSRKQRVAHGERGGNGRFHSRR